LRDVKYILGPCSLHYFKKEKETFIFLGNSMTTLTETGL
jgi:hypothetical protein